MTRSSPLSLTTARQRLALVWLLAGAALIVVLIAQTTGGVYGSKTPSAWGWLLASITPAISLILGTIGYQRLHPEAARGRVDRFTYQVCLGASIFYLALVGLTLLLQPFPNRTPAEWLVLSNLWLGPAQGLTIVTVTWFFQAAERPTP